MGNFQFSPEELFEAMKREIIRGEIRNDGVDLDRVAVLNEICSDMSKIFQGVESRVKLSPSFKSGHVSFQVDTVDFSGEQVSALQSTLAKCSAFEVSPRTDGNLHISFTVKGVYK